MLSPRPPCAMWAIWKGGEVEGTSNIGAPTLFIRSLRDFPSVNELDDFSWMREKTGCTRVWFCKEFRNWAIIKAIGKHFNQICIEVEGAAHANIPHDLRQKAKIYLKIPITLKDGDVVCIGPAFHDEAFEMGSGAKVTPSMYLKDVKIK